jgi:hypothetical protein
MIDVHINGMAAEDGSGDSWMIGGYITSREFTMNPWLRDVFGHSGAFAGLYHTRTRSGFLVPGYLGVITTS